MKKTIVLLLFLLAVNAQNFQETSSLSRQKRNAASCVESFSDFYFLIDIPRALSSGNLRLLRSYLNSIVGGLPIGRNRARVSITSFGTTTTEHMTLNDTQTVQNAFAALNALRLQRVGDKVRPVHAMDYMIRNLFSPADGYRDVNNSICVLVFGTRFRLNAKAAGVRLQRFCRVFAIGLGNAASLRNRISDVTNGPGQSIRSSRYTSLSNRVDTTLRFICRRPLRAPRPVVDRTTTTTVTISWTLQPFASGYRAMIQLLGGGRSLQTFNNIARNRDRITFTGLREATTYTVFVAARDEEGRQSPYGSVIAQTGLPVPEPRLEANSVTSTSAVVTWRRVGTSKDVRYFVTVSEQGGNRDVVIEHSLSGTRYMINNLKPGTRYAVTISSLLGNLRSEESSPITFITIPSPPRLRVARVKLIEMTIVWPAQPGAISYDIVMRDLQTQQERSFLGLTQRSLLIRGLVASRRYQLRATSIGERNRRSAVSNPLTVATAPSNPENITRTAVTTNSISFRWTPQAATRGYTIEITSNDHRGFRFRTTVSSSSFTATGLQPAAFYRIVVLSVGENDITDDNIVFPLIAQTVPTPPTGLYVVGATSNSIEIGWSPIPGARLFHVYTERLQGRTIIGNATRSTNTSRYSAVVSNLAPGIRYQFRVAIEAIQTGTSGLSNPLQYPTYAAIPSAPRSVQVTSTHIIVQLEPAQGAKSYLLTILSVDENGNSIGTVNRAVEITNISVPHSIQNLFQGTWYNISVRSVNWFDKVNPVAGPVLVDQTAPIVPFTGNFDKVRSTSLEYTWRPVSGAFGYVLIVSSDDVDGTEEFRMEYETIDPTIRVENLQPGTAYRFNLQSVGYKGRRSRTGLTALRSTVPDRTSNIRHPVVTGSTIQLQWDPTKGATNYRVRVESNETDENPRNLETRNTQITVSDLRGGTWYMFTIFARNRRRQEGEIGSDPVHVQTVLTPPTGVSVSEPAVSSFLVTWRARAGALGYRIRAFTPDSTANTKQKSIRVERMTEALIDDLDSGTLYRFTVASIGFQEQVSPASEFVTGITLPATPEQPIIGPVTSRTISISWNQVKGAVRYILTVVQDFPTTTSPAREIRTTRSQARVDSLLPGGWYNFTVISIGRDNRRNYQESPILRAQTVPLAPIAIDFDSFTTTSIRLAWNAVVGAGGYVITATEVGSDTATTEQETEGTTAVVTGLSSGTAYIFEVATIGEDGDRRSRTAVSAREETNPATPETPSAFDVTDEHIRFRWSRVKGARSYIVIVTNVATLENLTSEVSDNSAFVHDLLPGTLYMGRIFSVGVLNRQNPVPSNTLRVYTAPSPPTGIKTTNVTTTSLLLDWESVQGALSYRVIITNTQRQNEDNEKRISTTDTQSLIEDLEPGVEYQFNVRAIGSENRESAPHPEFRDATLPEIPEVPTVSRVFTTSIRFRWSPTPGALRYRVFVARESEDTEELGSINPTFILTDLQPGTRYSFNVQAVGPRDRMSARASASVRQQTITEPPPQFQVTNTRFDSISLSWTVARGASSYLLTVLSNDVVVREITVDGTSTNVAGLNSGTDYDFELRSVGDNEVRSSEFSELEEVTLTQAPSQVEIVSVGAEELSLNWQNVRGATHYDVRINSVSTTRAQFSEITLQQLQPGLFYEVQIYSIGIKDRLSEEGSTVIRVQTNPAPPVFRVDNVTTNSIAISWIAVVGASSFAFEVRPVTSEIAAEVVNLETKNTNLVISRLEPGVEYSITGTTLGQEESRRSVAHQVTDSTLPSRPSGLQIDLVTSSSIQISWQRQRGALAYLVDIEGKNEFSRTEDNVYVARQLIPGTFYNVVVFSIGANQRQNSIGSESLRVQTASEAATNFIVTEETTNSISLTWDDVVGRSQFEVVVNTVRNSDDLDLPNVFKSRLPLTHTTEDTSIEIADLPAGVEFLFRLKAYGQQGQLSDEESRVIGITLPTVPQALKEAEATTTTITISWQASEGAESYEVRMKIDDSADDPSSYTTEETRFTVTNLVAGRFYDFAVVAIGIRNKRNPQQSDGISLQTVPLPPQNFRVSETTTTEISLEWEDVLGRSRYSITVNDLSNDNNEAVLLSTEGTSIIVRNLSPGTAYRFEIQTIGMQRQKNSEIISVGQSTVPATIEVPTVVNVTTASIMLQWNRVRGAEHYLVETTRVDSVVPRDDQVTTEMTSQPSFVASDLIAGASYRFVIFSVGAENRRNSRGSRAIIQQTVTLPPDGAVIDDTTVSSFNVRWNEAFGATSYNVYVYELNEENAEVVRAFEVVEGTATTVTSLKAGTNYRVQIRSVGEYEVESTESTELELVTIPDTLDQPTITEFTTTSITLQWNPVAGAIRYVVEISRTDENADENESKSESVVDSRFVAENLEPGATYQIVVFSVGIGDALNENGSPPVSKQTVPLPPSATTAYNATETTYQLVWSEVYGADSYNIYVYQVIDDNLELHASESVLSPPYTVQLLNPGTEYRTRIRAVGLQDQESADSVSAVTATRPEAVSLITTFNIQSDSIDIEWDVPEGAQSYRVVVRNIDDNEETNMEAEMQTITVIGLLPGTFYEIRVISIGALSVTNTNHSVFARAQTVPLPPDDVQISDVTTTSFRLSWSQSFGAASYTVFVSSTAVEITRDLVTSNTSLTVAGLESGTQYYVTVLSTGLEGQQSDLTEAIEDTTIPSTIEQLDFSNRSSTTVTLLWEPVTGAVAYEIVYQERDTDSARPGIIESVSFEVEVRDLTPGTWYRFNIFSIGEKRRRNAEGSDNLEVQTVPLPPSMVAVTNIQPSTVVVSWNPSVGAASYRLTYQTSEDGTPTTINTASRRQEVAGLLSGTAYEFVVTTIGEEGTLSEPSQAATRTTLPATPQNVTVEAILGTTAQLSWTPERGAASYRVAVRNLASDATVFEMSSDSRITIRSLLQGISYEFIVFSLGAEQMLNEQGSQPITRQTIPRAPTGIVVAEAETNSLAVSWQRVTGAEMYFVQVTSTDDDAVVPRAVMTLVESVTFRSLSSGTVYSFSVTAIGIEGQRSEPGQAVSQTVLPGKPLGVRATAVTTTSITLEWQSVKGAIRYRVVATNQDNGEVQEGESVETGSDVTSLMPGNRYQIVIFSISADEKINPEGSDPLNKQTLTRPPASVQLSNITTTSLTLTWQFVIGAQTYIISTRSDDDDARIPSDVVTSQLSATINSFSSGTVYSFTVRAINFEEQSSRSSAPVEGITLPDNPNPVSLDDVQTNSIALSWPQIKGAIRYRIRLRNVESDEIQVLTRNSLRIEVDELDHGTWYELAVFSVGRRNTNGEGSDVIQVQTVPLPPTGTDAVVQNGDLTAVTMTWNEAKGAARYRAILTSEDSNVSVPSPVVTTNRTATFENLSHGTRYRFSVQTIGAQNQESEESPSIIRVIAPATINLPQITSLSENSITLQWQSVKGAVSYRIAVRNTETDSTQQLRSSLSTIEVSSLEAGTFYTMQVFSIGEEQENSVGSTVVLRQTIPESPVNVVVLLNGTTTSSLFLTWQSVKGARSYEIIFAAFSDTNENKIVSRQSNAEVSELMPGTSYELFIVAVGQEGQLSQRSGSFIAATKPEAVSEFNVSGLSNNSISLQWQRARGARIYRISSRNTIKNVTLYLDTPRLDTTVFDLSPGTIYEINVVSIGQLSLQNSDGDALKRIQTVPNPPRSVETAEIGTTSINVVWSSARGAVSYILELTWTESGEVNTRNFTTQTTSQQVNDLLPGTRYQFTVRTRVETGLVSSASRAIQETTRPDAATNVVVEEVTTTSATLRWGRVKGAQRYVVQYRERNAATEYLEVESTTTDIIVRELQSGLWYEFMVISVGARGRRNEQGSAILHLQTVPLAPSGVSINEVTTASFRVTWNNVVGAESFSIRVVRKEEVKNSETVVETEKPTIVIGSLASGTEYDVFVTAVGEENQRSEESVVASDSTLPETPQNLRLVQKSTSTANITWSDVKGAAYYELVAVDLTTSEMQTHQAFQNSILLTGLTPGKRYSVAVHSFGSNDRRNPVPTDDLQFQTVPVPPTNIGSLFVSTDAIRLQWNEALGAHSYVIRIVANGVEVQSRTVSQNNVAIRNLEPGTTYSFYLTSLGDDNQRSADSAEFQETTVPSTPTNVQVFAKDTTSATLTWDSVQGALSFTLEIESNNTAQEMSVQTSTNSYVVENLIAGGWYTVFITSTGVNGRRNPMQSQPLLFQTVPLPPNNVEVTDVSTDRIHLRWRSTLGAKAYVIDYENHVQRRASTSNEEYVLHNLIPGTQYSIRVSTVAEQGGLTSAPSELVVEITTIDAPETLELKDETTTTVTLSWESVEGTLRYLVRSTSIDGDMSYVSLTNETTIANLSPGTQYSFTVTTIDAKERESVTRSESSDVVTVTLPPANLQVHDLQSRSFVLAWTAPRGAVEYEITLLHEDRALTDETVTATSYTFSGLSPGVLYEVSITAINSNGKQSESIVQQQRTVPLPPSSLQVSDIRPNSLNISWGSATGASYYEVYVSEVNDLSARTRSLQFEDNFGIILNLNPGVIYRIAVSTVTEENIKSARNATTRQQTLTSAPANLRGIPVNESAISLDWDDVTGAIYYTVYYYDSASRIKKTVADVDQQLSQITSSEIVIGGLRPRVNYTFSVSASIADGLESDRSDNIFLETYALSPVLPVTNEPLITVSNITKGSFVLEWNPILNAVAYVIVVRVSFLTDAEEFRVSGTNTTRLVVTQQFPDVDYSVTLRAVGLIGDMTNESHPPTQFRTLPLAPLRPFGVRVTRTRATYFEIAWEIMPRALSYDVDVYDETTAMNRTIRNIQGTTANITNLVVMNYYLFAVTSVGQFERSPPSNPVRVQTRHPIPVMPRDTNGQLISVSNVTSESLVVTVTPIEYAASYIIIVRKNRATQERISDVAASTPVNITNLEQNTLYLVTYQAVGRGGERSDESNVIRTRTPADELVQENNEGRLIPRRPNDFQIVTVGPGEVTVQWSPARHAISYRINVQNTRTGVTRFFNNASSPFVIRNLEFRETYNVSVASVGKFFQSDFIQPIGIDIPYPESPTVTGVRIDRISTTSFRVRWLPAPFSVGYTVVVSEIGGRTRRFQYIRKIQYRVHDLRPGTTYNVTLETLSHNGISAPSNNFVLVTTASGSRPTSIPGGFTTREPIDVLTSTIGDLVMMLANIPDSLAVRRNGSDFFPREETPEEINYLETLEQRLQILRNEINRLIIRDIRTVRIIPRIASITPRFDFGAQIAFRTLLSLGRELKLLVRMREISSKSEADSIANRLTATLTELAATGSSLADSEVRIEIRKLLFTIVQHEVEDCRESVCIIPPTDIPEMLPEEALTMFVRRNTLSSSGFTVTWGRYRNHHRYQLRINETLPEGGTKTIVDGTTSRQSHTLTNLRPFTNYTIVVRPLNDRDNIIPGVFGRTRVTTLKVPDSLFNVNVTDIGYNDVTLRWDQFPSRVINMIFRIKIQGEIRNHQQFSVNRAHRSIRFTSLRPGTTYSITVTANALTFFSTDITTLVGIPNRITTASPETDALMPPSGLRVTNVGRNAISVEWLEARMKNVRQSIIRYNVYLYIANTQRLISSRRFIKPTAWTFRTRLTRAFYDVTVSTVNILTSAQSRQSPRLRIDTRNTVRRT